MKRFKESAPIVQAIRELEAKADELGIIIEHTVNGLVVHHKSSGQIGVYLDIDFEETTQFPHPFENKVIPLENYLRG